MDLSNIISNNISNNLSTFFPSSITNPRANRNIAKINYKRNLQPPEILVFQLKSVLMAFPSTIACIKLPIQLIVSRLTSQDLMIDA
jgi:hypothetical protein